MNAHAEGEWTPLAELPDATVAEALLLPGLADLAPHTTS